MAMRASMKSRRKSNKPNREIDIATVVEATLRVLQRDGLLVHIGHRSPTPTAAYRRTSGAATTPDEEDLG
jgi:hypothetical protein